MKIEPYVKSLVHNRKTIIKTNEFGEFLAEYSSIRIAAKENGMLTTGISNCLSDRSKTSGGFIWKYKKEE